MSNIQDRNLIYVKNTFMPEGKALISVRDRGFRFGDGVFETIRVHNGSSYQWDLHINRLKHSLHVVKIDINLDNIPDICLQLLKKNKIKNGFLRISISRGEGSRGYLPDIKGEATLVIETVGAIPEINHPVDLFLSSYNKIPNQCLPSMAKTMQGLNPTLARMEAQENQCFEALQLDSEGNICEGSSSNIFWFKNGALYTPSLDLGVLPGTIRDAVIRLSPYKVVQGIFGLAELETAEEVFLTNSAWLVVAVESLQKSPVPSSPSGEGILGVNGNKIPTPDGDDGFKFSWSRFNVSGQIKQLILQDMDNYAA